MMMNCVQVAALASVNTFNPNPLPITIISLTRLYPQRGEDWGSWYCSIGQLFLQYFGDINLEMQYCSIL